jgi:uncharacterized protein YjgD (DUF1641 family)
MAQPIQLHRVQTDATREVRARLEAASVEHANAILAAYKLLQELQDHGVLDLLRGLTGAGGEIASSLAEAANTPETIAAIRNIISMLRILGSIDPEILHGVADMVTKNRAAEIETSGLWRTLRRLGSKESRRAMGAAVYGLQVFGRVLISRQLSRS